MALEARQIFFFPADGKMLNCAFLIGYKDQNVHTF